MSCRDIDIKELLPAYATGELDKDSRDRVESHMAGCGDCRRELGLLTMMSEEAVPDPGEAFWAALPGKIEREVRARQAGGKSRLFPGLDRLVLPRWALTAAALGAILLVTWFATDAPHRGETPALQEVYDAGYASFHDPVLTHPSTDMSDLSDLQLAAVDTWAGQELTAMAVEAEAIMPLAPERDEYEALAELNGQEIENLATMLNDYDEEG